MRIVVREKNAIMIIIGGENAAVEYVIAPDGLAILWAGHALRVMGTGA